jgi:hypothetical protein
MMAMQTISTHMVIVVTSWLRMLLTSSFLLTRLPHHLGKGS